MSDEIIDLNEARRQVLIADDPARVLLRKIDPKRPFCLHRHYAVSMNEAEVDCQDCGASLDPWAVLRALASSHGATWTEVAMMRRERERLRADIAMLKAERAKLRKAAPKAGQRSSLEPTDTHRFRVHARGRGGNLRVSPWMTEIDARRIAKRIKGSTVEAG